MWWASSHTGWKNTSPWGGWSTERSRGGRTTALLRLARPQRRDRDALEIQSDRGDAHALRGRGGGDAAGRGDEAHARSGRGGDGAADRNDEVRAQRAPLTEGVDVAAHVWKTTRREQGERTADAARAAAVTGW